METVVIGFINPDDEIYKKYKKIYDLCKSEDVALPDIVERYFNYEDPECKLEAEIPKEVWCGDNGSGFEINVSDIPQGVSKIRFYNSW